MKSYSLSHVSDSVLLRDLHALASRERVTTAEVIAHIAEVDARKLYLPAAHPSMRSYCVCELGLSEHAAYKRIEVAKLSRQYSGILPALAEGRLNVSGVLMLASHLTAETADELIVAASGKTRPQLEELLARRCPRADEPTLLSVLVAPVEGTTEQNSVVDDETKFAPGRVEAGDVFVTEPAAAEQAAIGSESRTPVASSVAAQRTELAPGRVGPPEGVAPRYGLKISMSQEMRDRLRHAQALLGHTVPTGDATEVFDRALKVLIAQLEKRKLAATQRPRPASPRESHDPRHIPAHVKRAVLKRDGECCAFVGDDGRRCLAASRLEWDHILPVARGGRSTVDNVRRLCRPHNQYAAELVLGHAFMKQKREHARAFTRRQIEGASLCSPGST